MGAKQLVYVGIDLSTTSGKTGVCRINWNERTMELGLGGVVDVDDTLVKSFTAAAIDVPFGWPVDFVEAVRQWSERSEPSNSVASDGQKSDRSGAESSGIERCDDAGLDAALFNDGYQSAGERLRFRTTDRFVRKAAKEIAVHQSGWPSGLSVTKDMITGTALHAMQLLHSRFPDLTVGRGFEDTSAPVVEAYPATALRGWGLEVPPYKNEEGMGGRQRILEQMEAVTALDSLIEDHRPALEADDNLLDAFVCSLVARSWHRGHTLLPSDEEVVTLMEQHAHRWFDRDHYLDEVEREGWIAHPNAPLADALK